MMLAAYPTHYLSRCRMAGAPYICTWHVSGSDTAARLVVSDQSAHMSLRGHGKNRRMRACLPSCSQHSLQSTPHSVTACKGHGAFTCMQAQACQMNDQKARFPVPVCSYPVIAASSIKYRPCTCAHWHHRVGPSKAKQSNTEL